MSVSPLSNSKTIHSSQRFQQNTTPAFLPAQELAPFTWTEDSPFHRFNQHRSFQGTPKTNAAQATEVQAFSSDKKFVGGESYSPWIFDTLLYPVLTNLAVFGISVLATYATTYGGPKNWLRQRGDWTRLQLQKLLNIRPETAKETVMIAFSFIDGCVMAPVIKVFEDYRSKIEKRLDEWMGVKVDPRHYEDRPKQTWGSVLGGRATAFALVLPTAKLLSRKAKNAHSLNEVLFSRPGKAIGEWITRALPRLTGFFPRINIPGLAEVCVMEAFYTSLCTAGLYLSSRAIAIYQQNKKKAETATQNLYAPARPYPNQGDSFLKPGRISYNTGYAYPATVYSA